MTSIAILEAVNTTAVQFHGQPIITAMVAGVAYVAMKPIVENLGMSWSTQTRKLLSASDKFNCVHMSMVALDSKLRDVICIPLRKLNGWLFSINPEKVRADIRDKLIQYQEECFTVLHDYWNKGVAANQRKAKTTVDERTPLRDAVNMLVGKKGLRYDDAYNMVHQRFSIESIDELELPQIPLAVEYIHRVVLDGEYVGKQMELPVATKQFTDDEIITLSYLWLWMDKCQRVSKVIYPALKQIESRYAGMFYDIGSETRYITDTSRQALIRESASIDMNTYHAKHAAGMLARLRGDKEDDLIH